MLRQGRWYIGLALVIVGGVVSGCGGRSSLPTSRAKGSSADGLCIDDADCVDDADRCIFRQCRNGACEPTWMVQCDDGDACTSDRCEASSGECGHEPVTPDLDGDGHRAPLPGRTAGQVGACGDDCNDADARARPGAEEVCDGLDNDCNGVVDDRAQFVAAGTDQRVSYDVDSAAPEGIGYSPSAGSYLVSYSGTIGASRQDSYYVARISRSGGPLAVPSRFTHLTAGSYAGPLAWTGDRFGTLWADRRDTIDDDGNYELYFNEMGPDGSKRQADVRMTNSVGFSVGPALIWTGTSFVAAWQDSGPSGNVANQIFAQRVGLDARPVDVPVALVHEGTSGQEAPVLANGAHTIGVAWMRGRAADRRIEFATFDPSLRLVGGPVQLSDASHHGVGPAVTYGASGYTIAWYDPEVDDRARPIYAAVVNEDGVVVAPPRAVTSTPRHSRYPSLLGYGDRVLLVWSDDRDENLGYEVYATLLDQSLARLSAEMRLTDAQGDSVGPLAAFGPSGDVGIVFRDDRNSSPQTYFTALRCK